MLYCTDYDTVCLHVIQKRTWMNRYCKIKSCHPMLSERIISQDWMNGEEKIWMGWVQCELIKFLKDEKLKQEHVLLVHKI